MLCLQGRPQKLGQKLGQKLEQKLGWKLGQKLTATEKHGRGWRSGSGTTLPRCCLWVPSSVTSIMLQAEP